MKFLIIQTSFIGDVVLATGIAEKLHEHFPDARIDFLVRKGNEGLFEGHPFIKNVLVWNKKQGKYSNLLKLLWQIRRTGYDKVINLQRFAASGFLAGFSGAKETLMYQKNPLSFLATRSFPHVIGGKGIANTHEIERNHSLIMSFTDKVPGRPKLYPSEKDSQKIKQYKDGSYITVAPASVWFTKQYPREKWIEFLDKVHGHKVYLLGGPGDMPLCNSIQTNSNNKTITVLAGKLSYLETTALMQNAHINYTNDSAPMHFASAVNAPVAAIFCSTIPEFGFGPLSTQSYIIEERENLVCRPCGIHGRKACPLGHFKCAHDIQIEELVALC